MAKTNAGGNGGDDGDVTDAPLIDLNDASIKKVIARAKKRGYISYEQLNEALPQGEMSSDQIEDISAALSEMGINIVENDEAGEDGETEAAKDDEDDVESVDAEADGTGPVPEKKKETIDRTDDPVRMYLREMGAVELLSREGEIAIAKRIEAGRDTMILGLCESPITFNAIIDWSTALNEGTMQLREIMDLDAMLSKEPGTRGAGRRAPSMPVARFQRKDRRYRRSRKRPTSRRGRDRRRGRRVDDRAAHAAPVGRRGGGQYPQPRADGGTAQADRAGAVREHHRALQEILEDPADPARRDGRGWRAVGGGRAQIPEAARGADRRGRERPVPQCQDRISGRPAVRVQSPADRAGRPDAAPGRASQGAAQGFPRPLHRPRNGRAVAVRRSVRSTRSGPRS